MKKLALMFVVAAALAAGVSKVEAKSNYYIAHWNEGSSSWSYLKTDYSGCVNHRLNHPEDYIYAGYDCLA
jgi:hypothetical protein